MTLNASKNDLEPPEAFMNRNLEERYRTIFKSPKI